MAVECCESRSWKHWLCESVVGTGRWLKGQLKQWWEKLQLRREKARQLRQLLEMDDRMLKDIGLTSADVWRIAGNGRRLWGRSQDNPEGRNQT